MTRRRPVDRHRLDDVLSSAVAAGRAPGLVAVVADADEVTYAAAFGLRDAASATPMMVDTVFRLASMTKVATSLAALQLVEQSRLDLDAPVAEVVASWGDLAVLDGFDGDRPVLRPPRSKATMRHLLSHTSGVAYETWNPKLARHSQMTGAPSIASGRLASLASPMVADPGTEFHYGTSSDWLGLVVEAVSGQRLDRYFDEHLFGPLGMIDTTVAPDDAQRARCAPVHVRDSEGRWAPTDADNAREPEFWPGGHCLYSTPADYLRLQQILLRGGELDGHRVIGAESVTAMFENQTGHIDVPPFISVLPGLSASFDLGPGHKWGLGLLLNTESQPGLRASGSGGWAGVFNTFFWADRGNGVTAALYTQTLPFYDPEVVACYRDFERAVYT